MYFTNAQLTDLPLIVSIYNSTIASRMVTADIEPVLVAHKIDWFNTHNGLTRPLLMAYNTDQQAIGWVSFSNFYGRPAYQGTAEISIYIHEAHRGKGYGKAILLHCKALAPSLQLHTLLGYIFAHNLPSIHLFTKHGFTEWAHLKNIAKMDNSFYSLKILGLKVQ